MVGALSFSSLSTQTAGLSVTRLFELYSRYSLGPQLIPRASDSPVPASLAARPRSQNPGHSPQTEPGGRRCVGSPLEYPYSLPATSRLIRIERWETFRAFAPCDRLARGDLCSLRALWEAGGQRQHRNYMRAKAVLFIRGSSMPRGVYKKASGDKHVMPERLTLVIDAEGGPIRY